LIAIKIDDGCSDRRSKLKQRSRQAASASVCERSLASYELWSATLQHRQSGHVKLGPKFTNLWSFKADVPFVSLFFSKARGRNMKRIFAKFLADESGATAIEYGLIAAGISIAIIVAVNGIGSNLNTKFSSINTSLK
jgi:pilus assembly protein Flp/PilA